MPMPAIRTARDRSAPASRPLRQLRRWVAALAGVLCLPAAAADYQWVGGSGAWDTTTEAWSGAGTLWPATGLDNDAVFGVTTGTVTIAAGGVGANDIRLDLSGFVIGGNALTLNGVTPTFTLPAAVTARVDTVVAGVDGLVKAGAGELTLTGANLYTGPTLVQAGLLRVGNGGAAGNLGNNSPATIGAGATLAFFRNNNGLTVANSISGSGDLRFEGTGVSLQSDYSPTGISTGFTGRITVAKARLRANSAAATFGNASVIRVEPAGSLGLGFTSGVTITNALNLAGTGWAETNGPYGALRLENGSVVSGPIALSANAAITGVTTAGGGTVSGTVDTAGFTVTLDPRNGPFTLSGVVGGSGGLAKTGAGILNVTTTQGYGGGTAIGGGTLALVGADNRLPTGTTVNFSASGTLNLGANRQTLANLTAANGATGTVTGGGGTLTLVGNNFAVGGTVHGTAQTLDLRGLGTLEINNPARTFLVGGQGGGNSTETGTLHLAATNTVVVSQFNVGTVDTGGTNVRKNTGTVNLGKTNVVQADTFQLGMVNNTGVVQFRSGTASPTLTLRGTAGGASRVNTMILSEHQSPWAGNAIGTLDLVAGVTGASAVDGRVNTLYIAMKRGRNDNGGDSTGTLTMGPGTLDVNTVFVTHRGNSGGGTARGTLTLNGGTFLAGSLTLGYNPGGGAATATVNLNGGARLKATAMDAGVGTVTRAFNWNNGTIETLNDTSDLTITEGLTLTLAATGTHAFHVPSNRVAAVGAALAGGAAGTAALTKVGAGDLLLNGPSGFSGNLVVQEGTVVVTEPQGYAGRTVISGGTLRLGGAATLPVAGSQLWLDAATLPGAGAVSSWPDMSGNGRHATQATAANQPASTTSALLGGRRVVSFDGATDFLNANLSFLTGSSYTIFAVEGRRTSAANQYFLGTGSGTTNTSLHFGYRNNTTFTLAQYANDLDAPVAGYGTQVFRVWDTGLNTASGHTVHLNGARIASNANTTPFVSANSGLVGKSYGTNFYNGELAEVILYNTALSGPQRAAVDAYLKRKWFGLADPLPVTTEVALDAPGTTLDLNGVDQTVAGLTGPAGSAVTLGAGTLTAGGAATNTFAGVISGAGGLVKAGAGELHLTGANTYAGATVVTNGTLRVNGTTGPGALTVAAGARLTGGGAVGGTVTVHGELAPGNPAGTLGIGGSLVVAPGGVLRFDAGAPGDLLAVAGSAHLSGTIFVENAGGLAAGSYPLLTHGGGVTVSNVVFSANPPPGLGFALDTNTPGQVNLLLLDAWAAWQFRNFGCTNCTQAASTADPDGDGSVNADEYAAATRPTAADSVLAATAVTVDALGRHHVSWRSVGGKTYRLQYRNGNLPGPFTEIDQDLIPASLPGVEGSLLFVDDFTLTGGVPPDGLRLYRVRVLP